MPKKKEQSYKVDTSKKIVYRYNNVSASKQDEADILMYVAGGYVIKWKDKSPSVDEMRDAMKDDKKALDEFNRLYTLKTNINEKGKEEIIKLYDSQLSRLKTPWKDVYVGTSFGKTHIIETGNLTGKPLLVFHGGNATTAYNLLACDFIMNDFHI